MRVYHGSYVAVTNPDLMHSRENVDFGKIGQTLTLNLKFKSNFSICL